MHCTEGIQKEQFTGRPVLPRTLSACAFHWKLLWDLLYDVHLLQNGGCFTRRLVHFCIHLLSLSVYDLLVWRQCGGTAFDLVRILRSLFKMDTFSLGLPSLTRWLQKQCTGRFQCVHYNFCWGDGGRGGWSDQFTSKSIWGYSYASYPLYAPALLTCFIDCVPISSCNGLLLQWVSAGLLHIQFTKVKERTGKGINKKSSLAQLVHFNPPQMLSLSCYYY